MNRQIKEAIREHALPRRLSPHRIQSGFLKGSRIFTSWRDYPGAIRGTTESQLLEWFRSNVQKGETWIDVGAHYGYTALALASLVGPRGTVFAFEPVLASAGAIAITRRLNSCPNLRIVPLALGAAHGVSTFDLPITRGMADSTIVQGDWVEPLLVTSLDHIWPSISPASQPVHGIKIDVQGMEIDTLKGMRQILQQHQPKLVIEFHRGVERESAIELLREAGYSPTPQPIEGGTSSAIEDDKSYAFSPAPAPRAALA